MSSVFFKDPLIPCLPPPALIITCLAVGMLIPLESILVVPVIRGEAVTLTSLILFFLYCLSRPWRGRHHKVWGEDPKTQFIEVPVISISRVCSGASRRQSFWHLPKNLAHSDLLGLAGVKSLGKTTPQPSGTCRNPAIMVEGVIIAGAFHVFLVQGEE